MQTRTDKLACGIDRHVLNKRTGMQTRTDKLACGIDRHVLYKRTGTQNHTDMQNRTDKLV
jgi:hypothetical protein